MKEREFKKLVGKAILELPEKIRQKIDNCVICIEKKPSFKQLRQTGAKCQGCLLGLYEGVPKTTYGRGFGMRLPDKITIFQENIERFAKNSQEVKQLVKNVVWHEVLHHFGFKEKQIQLLEKRRKTKK